jgi:hypothetical protein
MIGPADQLAITKQAGDDLGAVHQGTIVGFSCFAMQEEHVTPRQVDDA